MSLLDNLRALVGAAENLDTQRRAVLAEIEQTHKRPASLDPAEIARKRDDLAAAELRLTDLDEALRNAEAARAETARKAEQEAADASHIIAEKQARADEKLVSELDALIRKVAAKRDELAASIARTAEANETRGARPLILDAERRVREKAGRTITAEFAERECWRDGSGREATVLRKNERGEMVPMEAGYAKVRERVQVRAERHEPTSMPQRYVDALVLVDLEGRPL